MSGISEKIIMDCKICGGQREFVRVIEAHVERERFTRHTLIGSPIPTWIAKTVLPIAYCPDCKNVIYIGPSTEDVEAAFVERQKESRS